MKKKLQNPEGRLYYEHVGFTFCPDLRHSKVLVVMVATVLLHHHHQPHSPHMSNQKGWYGVDLDGTLAHYDGWKGIEHIGEPVPLMLARVKQWLAEGREVRIFTARVGDAIGRPSGEIVEARAAIWQWCLKHLGRGLTITATKDMHMVELWDDRCVQVIPNTGKRVDGSEGPLPFAWEVNSK